MSEGLGEDYSKPVGCSKYASHGAIVPYTDSCVARNGRKPKISCLLVWQPQLHELGNANSKVITTEILVRVHRVLSWDVTDRQSNSNWIKLV
jgi:hypothetical protein